MELFIKYQIPSDLLSYDTSSLPGGGGLGSDVVSVREKLQAVKDHVAAIHEMIGATKKQELAQRLEEVQYSMECVDDCVDHRADVSESLNVEVEKQILPVKRGRTKQTARKSTGGRAPRMKLLDSSTSAVNRNVDSFIRNQFPSADLISSEISDGHPIDDCTVLPDALNKKFDQLDKDGAVRPIILTVGKSWKKRSQKALLSAATTSTLQADEQKSERSAAFDLLDALSRSGGLTLDNTDLHVVLMSTHCFDKTLMNTIIQKNTNPIEKMEQSTLVMASVIYGKSAEELTEESQHERLQQHATMLFQD
jgi:hypothetical protein